MAESAGSSVYSEYLSGEGYRPTLDADGDIVFKKEGKTFLVITDAEDPSFFRLVFPNFWEIESEEERAKVLVAANQACAATKVAKVFMVNDNVWASIELFVSQPSEAVQVFERCMSALEVAVGRFASTMQSGN